MTGSLDYGDTGGMIELEKVPQTAGWGSKGPLKTGPKGPRLVRLV